MFLLQWKASGIERERWWIVVKISVENITILIAFFMWSVGTTTMYMLGMLCATTATAKKYTVSHFCVLASPCACVYNGRVFIRAKAIVSVISSSNRPLPK